MSDDLVQIDHVSVAGRSLSRMEEAFADVGLNPVYGGRHDALPTHMSILGFDDGTYIELISKYTNDQPSPYWDGAIEGDAGPCAWAIRATDIDTMADRLRSAGITIDGPRKFSRDRPDDTAVEWWLAFPGDGDPGELLPFLIEDITPRDWRVSPTPSASDSELTGVHSVLLAVPDIEPAVDAFGAAFDLDEPDLTTVNSGPLAGTVAPLPAASATLLEPEASGPIADRLDRFGTGPCAIILETVDRAASEDRFGGLELVTLGALDVHLIDPERFGGIGYLGVTDGY